MAGTPFRILFVWPICQFSVWDVARGHRAALARLVGEENIRDYFLDRHTAYHRKALPEDISTQVHILSKYASESVLNEALYFNANMVFIVSGLNFHPIGLWLLRRVGIPAAVLFTESPYNDEDQENWVRESYPEMRVFTNDQASANKFNWDYVPHSFDPKIHRLIESNDKCDVVMVGTGWKERQAILEGVDWTGINLKLYGCWPDLTEASPIHKFFTPVIVNNADIAKIYCGAKICINFHRTVSDITALSLGPRAFEIAACGAFQLSDHRAELDSVFGSSVPTFKDSNELEGLIRYYLTEETERVRLAKESYERVQVCTFDHRAVDMLEKMKAQALQESVA